MYKSLVWFCLISFLAIICEGSLSEVLRHYDTLHHADLYTHHVSRRSTEGRRFLTHRVMSFDTLGKHFRLRLTSSRKLFSRDFQAVAMKRFSSQMKSVPIQLEEEDFYDGYLEDDDHSHVHAYFEKKNLFVTIKTKNEVYTVEPSWRHLPTSDNYTMIAYRASDVLREQHDHPDQHIGRQYCGSAGNLNDTHNPRVEEAEDQGYTYIRDKHYKNRYRRQTANLQVCSVVLVADYRFFEYVGESDEIATSKYLVGVLQRVSALYEKTDFYSGYTQMGFEIKKIEVYPQATDDPPFNKLQDVWETQPLLETFGQEAWSEYCLAHLFTYRAFAGGVQGLAWIASSVSNEVGGVCSQVYNGIHYNTAWTSHQNTGGNRILSQEADLITAHEFGHNWGSPHDPSSCAPSAFDGGKYIMYQYSVSGFDPNNDIFSDCSRTSVSSVLQAKSHICFTERTRSFCGNSQVEDGEECDAGTRGLDGLDLCCSPQCTLLKTAQCSDSNSECCKSCQFSSSNTTCRESSTTNCDGTTYCTGTSDACPAQTNYQPNGSPCLDRGSCLDGVCTPLCEYNNKVSCNCDEQSGFGCYYCCRDSAVSECVPYTDGGGPFVLPEGRTCYAGFCEAGECVPSDAKSTARLWDVIKSLDGNAILEWMRNNIVITVIVLSLFFYIPFCIVIWCIDRRRAKQDKDEIDWHNRDNDRLLRDGDDRNIRDTYRRRADQPRSGAYARLNEDDSEVSTSHISSHL